MKSAEKVERVRATFRRIMFMPFHNKLKLALRRICPLTYVGISVSLPGGEGNNRQEIAVLSSLSESSHLLVSKIVSMY